MIGWAADESWDGFIVFANAMGVEYWEDTKDSWSCEVTEEEMQRLGAS